MGYEQTAESLFSARRRHLDALGAGQRALFPWHDQLTLMAAGELLAEDLRMAQQVLGSLQEFSADDLPWDVFSPVSAIGKIVLSRFIPTSDRHILN